MRVILSKPNLYAHNPKDVKPTIHPHDRSDCHLVKINTLATQSKPNLHADNPGVAN